MEVVQGWKYALHTRFCERQRKDECDDAGELGCMLDEGVCSTRFASKGWVTEYNDGLFGISGNWFPGKKVLLTNIWSLWMEVDSYDCTLGKIVVKGADKGTGACGWFYIAGIGGNDIAVNQMLDAGLCNRVSSVVLIGDSCAGNTGVLRWVRCGEGRG